MYVRRAEYSDQMSGSPDDKLVSLLLVVAAVVWLVSSLLMIMIFKVNSPNITGLWCVCSLVSDWGLVAGLSLLIYVNS